MQLQRPDVVWQLGQVLYQQCVCQSASELHTQHCQECSSRFLMSAPSMQAALPCSASQASWCALIPMSFLVHAYPIAYLWLTDGGEIHLLAIALLSYLVLCHLFLHHTLVRGHLSTTYDVTQQSVACPHGISCCLTPAQHSTVWSADSCLMAGGQAQHQTTGKTPLTNLAGKCPVYR